MPTKTKPQPKSPLAEAPLRLPGQSLSERIGDVTVEGVVLYFAWAVFCVLLAFYEWIDWYFEIQPMPFVFSIIAIVAVGLAIRKVMKGLKEIKQLRLGMQGERAVGQLLHSVLGPLDYQVFHDLCERDYNLDHIVIGPGGVFLIETKTISKPERKCDVTYDGRQILIDGHKPDRDPLVQAAAGARRLAQILKSETGKEISVRSVVLYPGWYVVKKPGRFDTWVLNENAFVQWVAREPEKLSKEEIHVLSEAIARYQRREG